MDPFSVTAGAVALAANVLRAAAFVKDAADQFQDAPAVARDIEDDIRIVQAALCQVETALQRDAGAIWRLRLNDVFDLSVEGCRDTLCKINQEFETLFGRYDWRARIALWWNNGEIRTLLARLETRKGSLMLLVQALSLHSMQDLLHQHMRTLDISRFGLEHMVHSYPAYTPNNPDSMASVLGSGDGLFGGCDSVMSNTRFVFDDICLGSKPYRQSMARISAQKSQQDKGTVAARAPDSCAPSTVNWNTFEADTEVLGKSATRAPPAGAMGEEHEAVLIKFRNAEAMIGILQDQMLQPAALMAIQQADGPSQQSIQRRTMTGQAFEYSGMLQSRSVDVTKQLRAEVDGGFEAGFETGFEAGFEARFEARFRAGFMAGFGAGRMSCQAGDRLLPYLTEDVKLPTLGSYEIEALPIQSMLPTSMKRQPRPSQAHGWTAVSTQVPYQPVLSLKNTSPERGETSSFIDGSSIPTNHTPASPNWGRQPSGFPSQSPHGPLSRW